MGKAGSAIAKIIEIVKVHGLRELPTIVPGVNNEWLKTLKSILGQLSEDAEEIGDKKEKDEFLFELKLLADTTKELEKLDRLENLFVKELLRYTPNFILFSSFDDIFPNKISFISELEDNPWINDLQVVGDLDVELIKSADDRPKQKHKKTVNIALNDDYKRFWTQDTLQLQLDWDSYSLTFWVEEKRRNLPSQPAE